MKTNLELVKHVNMALKQGWGYVYGTYGTPLTEQLLKDKLKQYPKNICQYESFIRSNWMGKIVTDCVGLIKSYLWWNGVKAVYSSLYDVSANGMYERATEKGPINTMPEIPGLCVRFPGHIGVYIGDGWVIEARGTKYGVAKTRLNERPWTHWLKCPFIQYIEEPKGITIKINGKKIETDVDPINVNGRVLVPVRAVAESLGCTVEWDGTTQTVSITRSGVIMDDPCKKCNGHCNNYYVCEPKEQYDKCMTCANRVIASPECIGCDGVKNYKAMEQKKALGLS